MFETMAVNTLTHQQTAAHGRLRVFSLYVDYPGSLRARSANNTISQLAGQHWITSAEMWRLDSLTTSASLRKLITGEAANADILLVAASSLNYRPLELMEWLETLATIPTDRQNPGLLIGLFDHEDRHTSEFPWTRQQCLDRARPMNRDFIWHGMEPGTLPDYSWLKNHLEPFLGRKLMPTEPALLSGLPSEEMAPSRCSTLAA